MKTVTDTAHCDDLMKALETFRECGPLVERWGTELARRLGGGARLLVAGNGGSAAQAQHLTAELVGRYRADRPTFSALALHADTSSTTAIANDYGVQEVFARQTAAHGRPGDVLLLLSTSGASANLLTAAERAHGLGVTVWALTGRAPNPLHLASDEALCVDAPVAATVQELHLVAVHMLCESFDEAVERGEADGIPPTGPANGSATVPGTGSAAGSGKGSATGPAAGSVMGPRSGSAVGRVDGRPGVVGRLIGRARSVGRTPEPRPDGTRPRTAAGPANRPSGSPPGAARPDAGGGAAQPPRDGSGVVGGAPAVASGGGGSPGAVGSAPAASRDGAGVVGGAPGVASGGGGSPGAVGSAPAASRDGVGAVDGAAGPPPGQARTRAHRGTGAPRDGSRAPGQDPRRAAGDDASPAGPRPGRGRGAWAPAPGTSTEGDV